MEQKQKLSVDRSGLRIALSILDDIETEGDDVS